MYPSSSLPGRTTISLVLPSPYQRSLYTSDGYPTSYLIEPFKLLTNPVPALIMSLLDKSSSTSLLFQPTATVHCFRGCYYPFRQFTLSPPTVSPSFFLFKKLIFIHLVLSSSQSVSGRCEQPDVAALLPERVLILSVAFL